MGLFTALLAISCLLGAAIAAPKHNLGRQDRKMDTDRFFAAIVNDAAAAAAFEAPESVNSEGYGGYGGKPTKKPTTKPPTEKPTTKPPTEKPTTKPPTEKPTTKPPTGKPTTKPPTEKPTTKPTDPSEIKLKRVGYLDMTDPKQQCFSAWKKYSSPRVACGKKTDGSGCDAVVFSTNGASYQKVCGSFRGYQVGSPDGFDHGGSINGPYVDGISISYLQGRARYHIFTYAASWSESNSPHVCPCAGGSKPPGFVGSNFYCESGNPASNFKNGNLYYQDPLWDGRQCGGLERSCCDPPNLPRFCTTFPAPVTGDLEVRICTDQSLHDEDVAIEYLELSADLHTDNGC